MCCEVVICCNVKSAETGEKTVGAGEKPVGFAVRAGRAMRCWYRGSRRVCRGWHRAPAVAALADDNLAKVQTAGLQLNRLHALIAWRRGVLHRTAHTKAPELHETNARLTNLLAKC